MHKINVIGAGLITVDIIQTVGEQWRPSSDAPIYSGGGTVCNILCHLARTGWPCRILGGVGDDSLAEVVRADLQACGVDISSLLTRPGALTRRIAHLVATNGADVGSHRFELQCFSCRQDFPHLPPPTFEEISTTLGGAISAQSVLIIDRANELTLTLARRVAECGGVVVFEPGYLPSRLAEHGVLQKLMLDVDILKYSQDLRYGGRFFRDSRPQKAPRLKMIIETRGPRGVKFVRGNKEIRLTTTPIMKIVDSAGAGDAFMAGFLQGLGSRGLADLQNASNSNNVIEGALERGQALGGLACLFIGAKGILHAKTTEEIETAISQTIGEQRPPKDFGTALLPPGIPVQTPGFEREMCPVCRIPRRQRS